MFGKKLGIALAVAVMLAACGKNAFDSLADKNSGAATKEAAQIAINNGDYATAVTILQAQCPNNKCPDNATAQQLATAYMGAAGLDVLTVAKNADTNKSGGSDFATISKGLPTNITVTNLNTIANATTVLGNQKTALGLKPAGAAGVSQAASGCLASYTEEQKSLLLQLGISEATSTILAIGSQLGGFDVNGLPKNCNGNCGTADLTPLNAIYTGTVTYADYAATALVAASKDLVCVFGGSASSTNSTSQAINNLAANIQNVGNIAAGDPARCNQKAPDGYVPNFTGANVTTYLAACLK